MRQKMWFLPIISINEVSAREQLPCVSGLLQQLIYKWRGKVDVSTTTLSLAICSTYHDNYKAESACVNDVEGSGKSSSIANNQKQCHHKHCK